MAGFWKKFRFDVRVCIGLFGVIIATIALQAVAGYIFANEPLYTWAGSIGMALNTAIEFVFCGLGFILVSLSEEIWK